MKTLIIDDSRDDLYETKLVLKALNFEYMVAGDGGRGVEMYKANPDIGLVIMDNQMIEMNGPEAIKLIRQFEKETDRYAKIILNTSDEESSFNKEEIGFDAFVQKYRTSLEDAIKNVMMEKNE